MKIFKFSVVFGFLGIGALWLEHRTAVTLPPPACRDGVLRA